MLRSLLLTGMVLAFLACGDSSDTGTATKGDRTLIDLYSWPAGNASIRDLQADVDQCTERVRRENPDLEEHSPLVGIRRHMDCMQALGWHVPQ